MMKIGILRETKSPIDNRVALSPRQIVELKHRYPHSEFVVQPSPIRVFTDDEYRDLGISVEEDLSDCDVLFGIKEAQTDTLIPGKHYFFFGHVAKKQSYNRHLLQTMMAKGITFSDYEYLVDDAGQRLCAFGWWAGVVGVYYTLQGYGMRKGTFTLPRPSLKFQLNDLKEALLSVELPKLRILVTGNGRVSHGAQYILDAIGAERLDADRFLDGLPVQRLSYCVAKTCDLVRRSDGNSYSHDDFLQHPECYQSDFMRWAQQTDILVTCHFWTPGEPVYLTKEDLRKEMPLRTIGDVTCDIEGSIESTLRSSTHDSPFYDYNPQTESEEPAFSSDSNILVMAVDTCPNALAHDASEYFGEMLSQHVFAPLLEESWKESAVIHRSTILSAGALTSRFSYLEAFARGEE